MTSFGAWLSVPVTDSTWREINRLADDRDTTVADIARIALRAYLDDEGPHRCRSCESLELGLAGECLDCGSPA